MKNPRKPLPLERVQEPVTLPFETLHRLLGYPAHRLIAHAAGVTMRTVVRWAQANAVPWYYADRIATRFHRHPSEIWGEVWQRLDDLDPTPYDEPTPGSSLSLTAPIAAAVNE